MALGNKIQLLREDLDLSQKELANLAGVSTGTVAEWEADESTPNLTELARLSKALNVSSDILLDATTEEITAPMPVPEQELKPAIVSAKKYKKMGGIIAVAVIVLTLTVVGLFWFRAVPFANNTAAIEKADASVVTIFCYDYEGELSATGSGFVAYDGKTIITNYHVMTSAYTCKICTNQDVSYEVSKILCYSKEQDIAILQLAEDTGLQPLTLGDSSVIKKGETVVAIGSPLGIKNTVSTGVLSGRLMEDNMDVLQFTAPISSGSSGGALFDNNGNVIGVTYASYVDGQNLNLAIPVEQADILYNSKGVAKSASAIYTAEHPYISLLGKYNDIPKITIDEFLINPEIYNGKTIMVTGYLSSCYSDIDFLGEPYDAFFITTASYVTGNSVADSEMWSNAIAGKVKHRFIKFNIRDDEDGYYINDSILPGDELCWIGEIDYREGLNNTGTVWLFYYTHLCFSTD